MDNTETIPALVIGAGPAGLMAAEVLSAAGIAVTLADAMPSPGRKLLMAGKSGLNLTRAEPDTAFRAAFHPQAPALLAALEAFGPHEVTAWAQGLGQELFTGSTGRVFPKAMKASPLLRAWLARLEAGGVQVRRRWAWRGWQEDGALSFGTPQGPAAVRAGAVVLALGGASWPRLGATGLWAEALPGQVAPFAPANMGLVVEWSAHMAPHFGTPLKGIALMAGGAVSRGEIVLSARGLEGGGLYALSRPLRDGVEMLLDLAPDLDPGQIRARLAAQPAKASLSTRLRKALGLSPAKIALLNEWGRPLPADPALLIKALPVRHAGPRPLAEAISTAGGLRFEGLTGDLMLSARPGTFAAGEMLDWEAPTGGYLITGSLATGRAAGLSAAHWLAGQPA